MNTPSSSMPDPTDSQKIEPAAMSPTRPMYWSVRRELWENRSIYIAPLVAAAVVLFGFLISTRHLPESMSGLSALDPEKLAAKLAQPYSIAAMVILATSFLVAVFYCLDALHGERRDRSILFWKSLPVSDRTTVLAKASIPLVVLPVVVFAVIIALKLIMLLLSTAVLLAHGVSAATLWTQLPLFRMTLVLLYGLIILSLWYAPIYGWLLLVSGWARRTTFLWAVLPPLALCLVEKLAFNTSYLSSLLAYRLAGVFREGFATKGHGDAVMELQQLDPVRFLSSPGLWTGLLAAAALLAAAVWLRRNREPI